MVHMEKQLPGTQTCHCKGMNDITFQDRLFAQLLLILNAHTETFITHKGNLIV